MNQRSPLHLLPLLPLLLLLLACQPYLGGDDGDASTSDLEIGLASWQCPTPSPIPTITIMRGEWPTPERPTELPPEETWAPTAEPRIELSTPEPTATFYIR